MKDEKLLRLLKSDPDAGMSRIISQYSGLVFAIVRDRMSGACDSSEIEDCVADVFLHFQNGLGTFEGRASVKNYLAVIARNTAGTYMRNRLKTASITDDDFFIDVPDESDFTEAVDERLLLETIHREIRQLGEPDATIILRKYYFGQSSKQIAADLKMTVSNVDTRAHRAMGRLRAKFGEKYEEEF